MAYPKDAKEWDAIVRAVKRRAEKAMCDASADAKELNEAWRLLVALKGRVATGSQ